MPPPRSAPTAPTAAADRQGALRDRSAAQVAGLLDELPFLDEALDGEGPLALRNQWGAVRKPPSGGRTLTTLGSIMAQPHAVTICLDFLGPFELQLLGLAAFHGGSISRKDARAEVGNAHDEQLDAAAHRLGRLLLADPGRDFIALRPGVREYVALPGLDLREALTWVNTDQVAKLLRALGVRQPPVAKADRIEAYVAAMRDPETLSHLIGRLSTAARTGLERLLVEVSLPVQELGADYYFQVHRSIREATPLHELLATGLVGVDSERQLAVVWLDVLFALRGQLYDNWDLPVAVPTLRPLSDGRGAFPPLLGRLGALVDLWRREPADALQTGGIGVRSMRVAAKSLGVTIGEVGLAGHLAVRLGLLGQAVTGAKGRGRNRVRTLAWQPTVLADDWDALPASDRWVLLVHEWRALEDLDEREGLPERFDAHLLDPRPRLARECLLRILVGLTDGHGIPDDELVAYAQNRHAVLDEETTRGLLVAVRVLGLIPTTGPAGLTTVGRAVLAGPDQLAAAAADEAHQFTVQADLTVICPPDLAPDVVARLERLVDLESDAGARIYRISEARIGRALDAGETASSILDFLAEHAPTGVPQNVAHLVTDCERRHGRLRVGAASAYLHCDDPGLLARAASIKPAKLTILEPTVAVSTLAPAALLSALRKKDLMPVAESDDDAPVYDDSGAGGPGVRPWPGAPVELSAIRTARRPLAASDGPPPVALVDLAASLVKAEGGTPS